MFDQREPVIENEQNLDSDFAEAKKQWLLFTERVRTDILKDAHLREQVAAFIAEPVTEQLPHVFLNKVKQYIEYNRVQSALVKYVNLPQVDPDLLTPDIKNAPVLQRPEHLADRIRKELPSASEAELREVLEDYAQEGAFTKGVTKAERELILMRTVFARDVKIMALMASLLIEQPQVDQRDGQSIHLTSGVNIVMDVDSEDVVHLFNVNAWVKRKQLKDRVFEVTIDDKVYILKERKTKFHKDTQRHGYTETLTSLEEFNIAQELVQNGSVQDKDVKLRWERPVVSVAYPDGYQFTIFNHEAVLMSDAEATTMLKSMLNVCKEDFQLEYQNVCKVIKQEADINSGLTFDDFLDLKIKLMFARSHELQERELMRMGLRNRDTNQWSYCVTFAANKPILEIVGYDFELFEKITESVKRKYEEYYRKNIDYFYSHGRPHDTVGQIAFDYMRAAK